MTVSYWAEAGTIRSIAGATLSPTKAAAMRDFYLADIAAVERRPLDPEVITFIQERDLRCANELRAALAALQAPQEIAA